MCGGIAVNFAAPPAAENDAPRAEHSPSATLTSTGTGAAVAATEPAPADHDAHPLASHQIRDPSRYEILAEHGRGGLGCRVCATASSISVLFSSDGKWFISADRRGAVTLRDVAATFARAQP